MTFLPWFETNKDRFQLELDSLIAKGIEPEIDSDASNQGILRLSFIIKADNAILGKPGQKEDLEITASYPDSFPYFRPEVTASNLRLFRHQNPIGKNLCLLPRPAHNWSPEWTLADFLESQLSKVLLKGSIEDPEQIASDTDEQAEPFSAYYGGASNPIIFDDSDLDISISPSENVKLIGRIQVGIPANAKLPTRMAVLETKAPDGKIIGMLPDTIKKVFVNKSNGYLIRLAEQPPHGNISEVYDWILEKVKPLSDNNLLNSYPVAIGKGIYIKRIIGLCIPEEIAPGIKGTGWLFLIEWSKNVMVFGPKGKQHPGKEEFFFFGKVVRASNTELQFRVPNLNGLNKKNIAIVGLGALGAPATLDFARNQVKEIRIMDFDFVEPGPTVRWPLGLEAVGKLKTKALEEFIKNNYPNVFICSVNHKIGTGRSEKGKLEAKIIGEFINDSHLVFDATADKGISHYLANKARYNNIPFISVYATPGVWGGMIMRVVPGKTEGCWMCLQFHMDDKEGGIPIPLSDESGNIQALGCGDMTFTGASFDLQNISSAGVRLAMATLTSGTEGSYPDFNWDVAVLSMVDDNKQPIPPLWKTFELKIHTKCPYCGSES